MREGRFVALAVAVRAGQDFDRASRIDPHLRRFPASDASAHCGYRPGWPETASLDVGGNADPAQLAFGDRGGLPRPQALVIGERQSLVECGAVSPTS